MMSADTLPELKNKLLQKEKELYSIRKIGQALSSTLNIDDLLNNFEKKYYYSIKTLDYDL